ncbi:hypothetical protein [Sorangium cellulosum]|uniref:hypothetical protein n=1 Tax=Sorangium cellulosum TaxID=56 RepID=UPI0012DB6F37|nr:hypothetical protein [Sorangium cellulosum]
MDVVKQGLVCVPAERLANLLRGGLPREARLPEPSAALACSAPDREERIARPPPRLAFSRRHLEGLRVFRRRAGCRPDAAPRRF